MNNYLQRAEKVLAQINELASVSEDADGVTRTFGTPAFLEGSKKVLLWMKEAGLKAWIDNIGNVRGRLQTDLPNAKTLVIASHIDTVVNAGKFDGPLGVLLGMDLLHHLHQTKKILPFHIELIAFSDEEGVRFHTTYLGSKVVTGAFAKILLEKTDAAGITLQEAISKMGGDTNQLNEDAIPPNAWLGYFEIHIEQGRVLYEKKIPVGIVTSIAGQRRAEFIFKGMAGHAGTVPMDMRQDALCAAAECITAIEKFGQTAKDKIVVTVGRLDVKGAATNVIPGKVLCSLDLRSSDAGVLSSSFDSIKNLCQDICNKRNISFEWNLVQETSPVSCDEKLSKAIEKAIVASGHEMIKLVSGAGHDGVAVSKIAPVAMMFVRCFKGISHNPLEDVEVKDIAAAIEVSDKFILELTA